MDSPSERGEVNPGRGRAVGRFGRSAAGLPRGNLPSWPAVTVVDFELGPVRLSLGQHGRRIASVQPVHRSRRSTGPAARDPDSRARTRLANERTFLAWLRT